MSCIKYREFKFKPATLALIERANEIIEDFENQGYTLTLRQLYYQFVGKALIENSQQSYDNLGKAITNGRLAGMIDWSSIEDNHRTSAARGFFDEDELSAVSGIEVHLKFDQWMRQDTYVEVWVEKDALLGVIAKPCEKWLVPHMACKGYLSASEAWRAAQRFEEMAAHGKRCLLIHLGDHDPSGIDMTRDNQDRLDLFAADAGIEVKRIALNMDQVQQYKPPPNPAKITDSRATGYLKAYGNKSWELDALSPSVIDALVTAEIKAIVDMDIWRATKAEQDEGRKIIAKIADHWEDDVRPFLEQLED